MSIKIFVSNGEMNDIYDYEELLNYFYVKKIILTATYNHLAIRTCYIFILINLIYLSIRILVNTGFKLIVISIVTIPVVMTIIEADICK